MIMDKIFAKVVFTDILHVFFNVLTYEKKMKMRDFKVLFLRKAQNTEHPSQGCPHLVFISQLSRMKQCG